MAKQYLMPYTNLHELNLDWLINAMKQLEASWEGAEMKVTATASATAGTPTVKVSGNLKDTLNFDFGLPEGNSYPSDTVPKPDNGSGLVGIETTFARGDHVHPSDSTKLDKVTHSDETALYAVMNDKQITLPYSGFATSLEVESIENNISRIEASLDQKQDTLVSGANIKTINNYPILGEGDISTSNSLMLWANSDVTSAFEAQDITLSSSNFANFLIIFRVSTTIGYKIAYFLTNQQSIGNISCTTIFNDTIYNRSVSITANNNISFAQGYTGSYTTISNTSMIPCFIIGIE